MTIKIVTNWHRRDVVYGFELSDAERAEFDYYDWQAIAAGNASLPEFVRYRGELIDLGDMERGYGTPDPAWLAPWDNYLTDTFGSATVVMYPRDDTGEIDLEHVIVGRMYAS